MNHRRAILVADQRAAASENLGSEKSLTAEDSRYQLFRKHLRNTVATPPEVFHKCLRIMEAAGRLFRKHLRNMDATPPEVFHKYLRIMEAAGRLFRKHLRNMDATPPEVFHKYLRIMEAAGRLFRKHLRNMDATPPEVFHKYLRIIGSNNARAPAFTVTVTSYRGLTVRARAGPRACDSYNRNCKRVSAGAGVTVRG